MSNRHSEGKSIVVGKEISFQAQEEIGEKTIRRFSQTIGDRNPLYSDEKYAKKSRYGSIIAPPTLIFELGYDLGEDINVETGLQTALEEYLGYPKNVQRLRNEYEILEIAHPSDIITAKRKIIESAPRQGKSGKWIFITSEILYSNQSGKLLGINKETLACQY